MKKLIATSILAGALVLGGVAYAAIPDSSGVIHGCRNNLLHTLSVVDSATSSCPPGTTALNWSQTGPTGPAGPQGPQGDPAPTPTTSTYAVGTDDIVSSGQSGASADIRCDRNISSDQVVPGSGSYGFYILTTETSPSPNPPKHVSVTFDGAVTPAHGGSQRYDLVMQFDPYDNSTGTLGTRLFVRALCIGPTPTP